MGIDHINPYIHSTTVLYDMYMHMYCLERSFNISITRITRVNNICFWSVAISDDISTHADFQVLHNTLQGEITISST